MRIGPVLTNHSLAHRLAELLIFAFLMPSEGMAAQRTEDEVELLLQEESSKCEVANTEAPALYCSVHHYLNVQEMKGYIQKTGDNTHYVVTPKGVLYTLARCDEVDRIQRWD
jgi:hypothetical protein